MNYFEILSLPMQFDISLEQLENQLIVQSNQHNQTLLNTAYNTLKDDYERGKYIAKLQFPHINMQSIKLDKSFLQEILEYKINHNQIKIQNKYNSIYQEANLYFTKKNAQNFCHSITKLLFLKKLLQHNI
ncbi:MAG: hypothetical protein AAFO15_00080 [Pseudomonadota bacterium]